MERVDNQAEDRVPAAKTANRSNRKIKEEDAVVEVPAGAKAGVVVVDRDGAEAQVAVTVNAVDMEQATLYPEPKTRRTVSCQD
jgi:hypothetical protein